MIKRTGPIRELARFIIRSGRKAYLLPPGILAKADQYIPYIFSESELSSFFNQSDCIEPTYKTPGHYLIISVIFRLIYSCGLRPSEALSLRCSDIDFVSGRILIRESKGYKTRYVYLSDDMLLLCIKYSAAISKVFPDHCYLFPKSNELPYTTSWLTKIFKKCWYTCYPCSSTEHLPRVYDFRHTFASRRLYLWIKDEIDITHMLPYLSAYMGHTSIRETAYYLHLVPEFFKKGNMNEEHFSQLFPEVIE